MSSTANGWPRAVVTMDAAGRAHVNLSGVVTSFEEGDAEAVRTSVIRFIVQRALVLGREIPASISEPNDHWEIVIHPDGMVTENPLATQDPARCDDVPPPQAVQPAHAVPPEQPAAPVTAGYGYVPEAGTDGLPIPALTAGPGGQEPATPPPARPPAPVGSPAPAGSPALPSPAEAVGPLWAEGPTGQARPSAPTGPATCLPPVVQDGQAAWTEVTAGRPGPHSHPNQASESSRPGHTAQPDGPGPFGHPAQPSPARQAGQGPGLFHHSPDPLSWQEGVPAVARVERARGAAQPRPTGPDPGPLSDDRAPARTGLRGAVNRVGLRLRPSRSEQEERRDIAAVSTHWSGSRTIAVVNGKGGSMKTPTAVLLSAVFARHGGTGVVAFDNNPARGTLGWRTEQGPHERTVVDLLPSIDHLLSPEAGPVEISAFTHHQSDGFDVLRSRPEILADDQPVTAETFTRAHDVLSWYYRLVVIDSGNDEGSPAWRAMIARADAIVVPTITRPEHAESARLLLSELSRCDAHGADLASRALVVVSQGSAAEPKPDDLVSRFQQIARAAIGIPYDPMMAGRPLHLGSLAPATQRAWLHAAARLAAGLE